MQHKAISYLRCSRVHKARDKRKAKNREGDFAHLVVAKALPRMHVNSCIAMEVAKKRDCKEQTVGQPGGSPRSRTRRDRGRSSSGCCRTFPARTDSITSQGKDMANVPAPLVKLAHVPWHSIVAIERSLTLRYLSHFYDTVIAFAGLVQNRFSVFFL